METENSDQQPRKNSNKIYFLVAVILALLGTNAYLFFKDKEQFLHFSLTFVLVNMIGFIIYYAIENPHQTHCQLICSDQKLPP